MADPAASYRAFLGRKAQEGSLQGFEPLWLPDFLFGFQQLLVDWNLHHGRSASFADCGLGKTPMQLVWAENVARHTGKSVLILTPLAVAGQTVREAEKFGIEARKSSGERRRDDRIIVTNYEKLHHFSPGDFGGVVCDESSAIKAFNGRRRAQVTEFLRTVPYRHLCTATAAPNDYTELGTSSEALGHLGLTDMLTRFFVNDQNNVSTRRHYAAKNGERASKWRFKGHAKDPFWRWVCSWARTCRKPSDLGFTDDGFDLPPLIEREHVVKARSVAPGLLFPVVAQGIKEEREERRRTLQERCEKVAELVDHDRPAVVWCDLNDEGDLLEEIIPDARQVKGAQSEEQKEEIYEAFASGEVRALVSKRKIGAWGLNWQHCAHVVAFATHSWEQDYQSVRRCWRFGQKNPVIVDRVATEGEAGISKNLARKAAAADRMFDALVANMAGAEALAKTNIYTNVLEFPSWLSRNQS